MKEKIYRDELIEKGREEMSYKKNCPWSFWGWKTTGTNSKACEARWLGKSAAWRAGPEISCLYTCQLATLERVQSGNPQTTGGSCQGFRQKEGLEPPRKQEHKEMRLMPHTHRHERQRNCTWVPTLATGTRFPVSPSYTLELSNSRRALTLV